MKTEATSKGILAGKTALVTGSSRGIGKAIATEFARAGADVAICSRTEQSSAQAARELEQFGVRTLCYGGNVASAQDTERMLSDLLEKWKTLDILVNNAGVTRDGLIMRMKEEDWDEVLDTNLKSAFHYTRVASRAMMRQKRGAIINISSVVGLSGNPGQCNYAASKAGLIGFTKAMARELASRNVTVNAIAPGYITTDMTQGLTGDVRDKILSNIPLGRLGEPADIAAAALFLASDAARYITGQVLVVDGGMTM